MNNHVLRRSARLSWLGAGAMALAGMLANPVLAEDKELLDTLLKNGIITNEQHQKLSAKGAVSGTSSELLDILAKNGAITKDQHAHLAKKQAEVKQVAAKEKPAEEKDAGHVKLGANGLEFESNDGNFKAKIGGRIQVDSQVNWNDPNGAGKGTTDLANNVGFRRARIYTEGTFFKDYDYRFEYDWARNGGCTQGITDAFVRYTGFKPFSLSIGQLSEGKSMESVMSNNYLTFIERSLPNNAFMEAGLASKYQLGIIGDTYGKLYDRPYTLRGGITTESVGAPAPGNSSNNAQQGINRNRYSGNIGYQLVGRATFAPYRDPDGTVLHTGAWGSWRSINNHYNTDGSYRNGGWQFVSQPDTNMDRTSWLDTGNLTKGTRGAADWREVDDISMYGLELAGAWGPAHFSAEYMQAQVSGRGYGSEDTLEGYYVYAGYFLTGETRPYDDKKGVWGRVMPKHNFLGGSGWGAWEVAARYDVMDMNTKNIHGGSLGAGTLALNWYLTPRLRFMTNWVHVFNTRTAQAGSCKPADNSTSSNASIACFNGLNPDIWETAVRFDF